MRKIFKLAALAALLFPALASAQLSLGARVGYGIAMGEAVEDGDLSDGIKGQIPIQIDVGYRMTPALTLGGYFSAGLGVNGDDLKDLCDAEDLDCSTRVYRLGVQGDYAFRNPARGFTPWVGAGIGYEWASLKQEAGGEEGTLSYRGFEFLNLQGGVDWKVGQQLSFGPFVMLSIAQYSNEAVEAPGIDESQSIPEKGIHQWLQIGLRGRFDL